MKALLRTTVALGALLGSTGLAVADCGIAKGSVRILSNDFEALHVVAAAAEECASDTVEVTKNATTEHKNIQVPALTTDPATYTVAMVANNSVVPLLSEGLIRPLDDLVAKYGQNLQESQLIRIDGKVMAIAFMANAQHLFYRKDVLEANGLPVPKTFEEVLANAQALRDKGVMQNPLALNMKPGWDLAAEFVNMYSGMGGEFFVPGTGEVSINNEAGVKTLEMIKALTGFMGAEYITYDTNSTKPLWEANTIAMMQSWGSRAGAFIDPAGPAPDIAASTVFDAAPTVGGGSIPAAMLWWDGFVIAKNIPDEDAEASFQAMMHALSEKTAVDHAEAAVWLIKGYQPTPASAGVLANLANGAKPYPMVPYMGLLHTALGDNLAEYFQGQESAEQALTDVTAAYTTAAKEAGFLK